MIVNREEAWNALGIDISDEPSKCMFDEIKQLVNRIDSVNWLEQQTITSRFHQLLMNYIFFAETGADQKIIDEQMKTLLDSFGVQIVQNCYWTNWQPSQKLHQY